MGPCLPIRQDRDGSGYLACACFTSCYARPEPLLEAERVAAIRIIGRVAAEQRVAGLAVAGDGGGVLLMDLEAKHVALPGAGGCLRRGEQRGADPAPARLRRDCDGIEPRRRACGATAME